MYVFSKSCILLVSPGLTHTLDCVLNAQLSWGSEDSWDLWASLFTCFLASRRPCRAVLAHKVEQPSEKVSSHAQTFYQASACFMDADIPLTKASHMTKASQNGGKNYRSMGSGWGCWDASYSPKENSEEQTTTHLNSVLTSIPRLIFPKHLFHYPTHLLNPLLDAMRH